MLWWSEFWSWYTASEWVIRLVMLVIVVNQRRPPRSAMAWLMVIFFLPWPGLLHSKTMSIDNAVAFLGTGNFDIRSFALNFEVNLLLYDKDVTERLRAEQQEYIDHSVQLTREEWQEHPIAQRTVQHVAKLLSPLW